MKRRQIIQSIFLGSTALSVSFLNSRSHSITRSNSNPEKKMKMRQVYDWIFLYWMPYDNDLSRFGQEIIQAISSGIRSKNLLVAVEADFLETPNITRYVLTQNQTQTQQLHISDSASEDAFAEYLTWAQSQFEAKHWAIVFLGHGGNTDEISPDIHSGVDGNSIQWMNIQSIADRILEFNQRIGDRIELFFFQNCNKGTLEAHSTISEVARYTLSSQKLLGAPNYYYPKLFQWLGKNPEASGEEVARKVEQFERSDMYSSYTVTNNSMFRQLKRYLVPLIDTVLAANLQNIELHRIPTYDYFDEFQADAIEFFTAIVQQSNADRQTFDRFIDFVEQSTIHLPNPQEHAQNLSGLGLFVPTHRQQLDRYRNWQIYADLKLLELFDAIFDSTPVSLTLWQELLRTKYI